MQPSVSLDLNPQHRARLLALARDSITVGADGGGRPRLALSGLPSALQEPAAAFVTLTCNGRLRGCVGSLEPRDPLAQAVSDAAYSAACRDSRFAPLQPGAVPSIRVEVSVLSPMRALAPAHRRALLDSLRPGCGLLLEEGRHSATFLPKVWEQLPEPGQFLSALLEKAGLAPDYWSDTLRFQCYSAVSFSEEAGGQGERSA